MEWISLQEKEPVLDTELLLHNPDWITHYNPHGIRTGFFQLTFQNFMSCEWVEEKDSYCNGFDQPTHWALMPNMP